MERESPQPIPIFARSPEARGQLVVEMSKLAFDLYRCSPERAVEKIISSDKKRTRAEKRLIQVYFFLRGLD